MCDSTSPRLIAQAAFMCEMLWKLLRKAGEMERLSAWSWAALSCLGLSAPACGDHGGGSVDTRVADVEVGQDIAAGDAEVATAPDVPEETSPADALETQDAADSGEVGEPDPGALVRVTVSSRVGFLLEDVPAELRDRVASDIASRPDAFWLARVEMQLAATRYRLGYRRLFTLFKKGILPLPPASVREVTLDPAGPARVTIDGHDIVAIGYSMSGVLLSDADSVALAESELADVGARWVEPFVMPADPDLLMQRTGMACVREIAETSDLLDADNALRFFDDTCTADGLAPIGCHRAPVAQSCVDAMHDAIGTVDFPLTFERLAWDGALADEVRVPLQTEDAPDLKVLTSGLENHQILYNYIAPDSCSVAEQCVRGSGWRRLLRFDASLENVGSRDLSIGPLQGSPFVAHNVFEFSPCHEHYHFRFYGDFTVENGAGDQGLGDKRAFCLLSTSRYANDERVPLTHEHDYCKNQGIVRGWGDDYFAGLDCQWIDITDLPVAGDAETMRLSFHANPVGFLCEGTPRTDEAGEQLFSATDYVSESGEPIDRPECDLLAGYDDNNHGAVDVVVPAHGGLVTQPCTRGQLGPRRDCGFSEQPGIESCTPGATVTLTCSVDDMVAGQMLRACETSAVLGAPLACAFKDSLASVVVRGAASEVSFTCPAARDAGEPGDSFALYHAPILDEDSPQPVRCTAR